MHKKQLTVDIAGRLARVLQNPLTMRVDLWIFNSSRLSGLLADSPHSSEEPWFPGMSTVGHECTVISELQETGSQPGHKYTAEVYEYLYYSWSALAEPLWTSASAPSPQTLSLSFLTVHVNFSVLSNSPPVSHRCLCHTKLRALSEAWSPPVLFIAGSWFFSGTRAPWKDTHYSTPLSLLFACTRLIVHV